MHLRGLAFALSLLLAFSLHAKETVIPLQVESGEIKDGRDTRVFAVPVVCQGIKADFTWACGGKTILSEAFARKCDLRIEPDDGLAIYTDAAGKPLFLGYAYPKITLAGRAMQVTAMVMRDSEYTRGMSGIIGYEIATQFQWEIDPSIPQLTLREPGARGGAKPIAILKLVDRDENL